MVCGARVGSCEDHWPVPMRPRWRTIPHGVIEGTPSFRYLLHRSVSVITLPTVTGDKTCRRLVPDCPARDGRQTLLHCLSGAALSSDNQDENVATIRVRTRGRDATSTERMAG